MAYDVGQMVRLPVTVKDAAGVLTNATMAIEVRRADDTVVAPPPTIVNDSTGVYHADVVPDASGPWTWKWTSSGAVVGVHTGQFFVRLPGPRIVSLREVKDHLNKSQAVTTDDEDLRDWIDTARWVIERITGPVVPRTVVEAYDGGRRTLHLRTRRVMSVTEVRETWGPDDQRTITAEPDTGPGAGDNNYLLKADSRELHRRSHGYGSTWAYGTANIRVTYRVGQVPMPENARSAALELISHMWRASQLVTGATRPRPESADVMAPAYAVPNRVRELLGEKPAPRLGR